MIVSIQLIYILHHDVDEQHPWPLRRFPLADSVNKEQEWWGQGGRGAGGGSGGGLLGTYRRVAFVVTT